jgi:hypothetical protein
LAACIRIPAGPLSLLLLLVLIAIALIAFSLLTCSRHSAWLSTKKLTRLTPAAITAYVTDQSKKPGKLIEGYRKVCSAFLKKILIHAFFGMQEKGWGL